MSKKSRWKGAKVVLGPNGKPLPPSPRPASETAMPADGDWLSSMYNDIVSAKLRVGSGFGFYDVSTISQSHEATVKADLLAGLDALVADLHDFETGVRELPEPDRDMSTYADAFAVAAKACKHPNYEDTMYAKREAKCHDCGKYFVKPPGGLFGW